MQLAILHWLNQLSNLQISAVFFARAAALYTKNAEVSILHIGSTNFFFLRKSRTRAKKIHRPLLQPTIKELNT